MDDRVFLHDGERLLVSMRSSPAVLAWAAMRSVMDALIAGALVSVAFFAGLQLGAGIPVPWWAYILAILALFGVDVWLRYRSWAHGMFRVTTERILIQDPRAFFHGELHTIKWAQYQEGIAGHRHGLDLLFGARPLVIRHGTADSHRENAFPSLRYASDLKHYLDKVDSAVRRGEAASLHPFVQKPRGKRDDAPSEHSAHPKAQ